MAEHDPEDPHGLAALADTLATTKSGREFLFYGSLLAQTRRRLDDTWSDVMRGVYDWRPPPPLTYAREYEPERAAAEIDPAVAPGAESDWEDEGLDSDAEACWEGDDEEVRAEAKLEPEDHFLLGFDATRIMVERARDTCVVGDPATGTLCHTKVFRNRMCRRHYRQWRRSPDSRCSVAGCGAILFRDGRCRRHQDGGADRCTGRGPEGAACGRKAVCKGFCMKHYRQHQRRPAVQPPSPVRKRKRPPRSIGAAQPRNAAPPQVPFLRIR